MVQCGFPYDLDTLFNEKAPQLLPICVSFLGVSPTAKANNSSGIGGRLSESDARVIGLGQLIKSVFGGHHKRHLSRAAHGLLHRRSHCDFLLPRVATEYIAGKHPESVVLAFGHFGHRHDTRRIFPNFNLLFVPALADLESRFFYGVRAHARNQGR